MRGSVNPIQGLSALVCTALQKALPFVQKWNVRGCNPYDSRVGSKWKRSSDVHAPTARAPCIGIRVVPPKRLLCQNYCARVQLAKCVSEITRNNDIGIDPQNILMTGLE